MSEDSWNTNENLKWGYFFYDKNKNKLEKLLEILSQEGFELNVLHKTELGDWKLNIQKIETITPEVLHKRNLRFNKLAESFSIELYDGWDVEK